LSQLDNSTVASLNAWLYRLLVSSLAILASSLASQACLGDLLNLLLLSLTDSAAVVLVALVLQVNGDVAVSSPSATTTIPAFMLVPEEQTPCAFLLFSSFVTK
jgi:hypothetical protein